MPIILIVTFHHMLRLLEGGGWACWRLPHMIAFGHWACTPH